MLDEFYPDLIASSWEHARSSLAQNPDRTDGPAYPEYKDDPNGFLREVVGWEPWTAADVESSNGPDTIHRREPVCGQDEWGEALVRDKRVSIVACNGSGKTHYAAGLVLWFMSTRLNPTVVTVAPKWKQVKDFLWRYLRGMFRESKKPLPGQPLTATWELSPTSIAEGFSTNEEERAQGFHAYTSRTGDEGDLLVIVDEASGVKQFVYNAIKGWLTKGHCYVLYIGNANQSQGTFYESHQSDRWTRFQVSALNCPTWLVKDSWIEDMKDDPGEGTPQWTIRVEGEFSEAGGRYQLFPSFLLRQAEDALPCNPDDALEAHVGVDLADTGHDKCVATLVVNGTVKAVESWNTEELMVSADNIEALAESWGLTRKQAHRIHIDSIGIGSGVCSRLRQKGWYIDPVNFGSPRTVHDWRKLVGDQTFLNRKAELHWILRRLLIEKRIAIPREFKLTRRQLLWLNYEEVEGSEKIKVESKKKLPERGIQGSPDYADSLVYALSRAKSGRSPLQAIR